MSNPIVVTSKIPSMDFRGNKMVNEDGTFTDVAQSFFDALAIFLNKNVGDEGFVIPSQTAINVSLIQDNVEVGPTGLETNTCDFSTLLYDETNNVLKVALNDGTGNPIFKEIVTM